eukprot:49837-Chlamydomonas_euryale.AAC.2
MQLPPKTEGDIAIELSREERELYMRVHAEVSRKWTTFRAAGPSVVNKYQMTIMSLLGPLRRICSGGNLRERDVKVWDGRGACGAGGEGGGR